MFGSQPSGHEGPSTNIRARALCPIQLSSCWRVLLAVFSVGLVIAGLFSVLGFPPLFNHILRQELTVQPGTAMYSAFKKSSVPTKIRFYLWSVENPEEVEAGHKPSLKQVGPFVYREELERVEDEFSKDMNTISFKTKKVWYPIASESESLEANVTTLDMPQFAAGESARGSVFQEYMMAGVLSPRNSLFVTRPAREWLFEGFEDPLLTIGSLFKPDSKIPMDKFGWFYKRNGTTWSDDVIAMKTGLLDYPHLGDIVTWKGLDRTFYNNTCGQLKGSAAGFLPVDPERQFVDYFSPDICRPIRFSKSDSWVQNGLPVDKFSVVPWLTFGNRSTNPDNWCYNDDQSVLPAGLHNSTGCKDEGILPVFVSLPHFHGADPYFANQFVEGTFSPSEKDHGAAMVLQTNTSIPLLVQMRLQIIMQIRPNENLGGNFARLSDTFLPVIWFDAEASSTPELEDQVWFLVNAPHVGSKVGVGLLVVGLVSLVATLALSRKLYLDQKIQQQLDDQTSETMEDDFKN